jgi:Holliday junction resolvasome RuvABC endonuclease subunit
MLILGIDPGKKASAVILDENLQVVDYETWNSKHTGIEGQMIASRCVSILLDLYQPNLIGIESPVIGFNAKTSLIQGYGVGALYITCSKYETPRLINPSKVHKLAGDTSSIKYCIDKGYTLPNTKWRQDTVADSIAIAIITYNLGRIKNDKQRQRKTSSSG